ncbi:Calpain-8 [Manis pentadactyla]|nr:Calpain-8 [Manis pentadactyla]
MNANQYLKSVVNKQRSIKAAVVCSEAEAEAITSQKLVKSHAYSVTGVQELHPGEVGGEDGNGLFKSLFGKLAVKDSEISANELKTILNEVFSKHKYFFAGFQKVVGA